ncbi:MAG: pentapeptide repeat-containing protein [Bacteroidales bacterium]
MRRDIIRKLTNVLPDMIKEVASFLKSNFNSAGPKAILSATGTVGLVIRLFGSSIIENYFKNLSKKKLEDYGSATYMAAAFLQAESSLNMVAEKIDNAHSVEDSFEKLQKALSKKTMDFEDTEILVVFQPKYHPAVLFVKNSYTKILQGLGVDDSIIDQFLKNFNQNIATQVRKTFGEDWEEHQQEIGDLRLSELETDFLWSMKDLGKIGFKENEDLKYETTYAKWVPVEDFREVDDIDLGEAKTEEQEAKLEPADRLIDDYFNFQPNNNINKILFVLGDFGKGKSVFLKHYASTLAKEYLTTGEGRFPVYFNLRNFKKYYSEYKLGIIADYLETDFGISVEDPYFNSKNFVFLIDSLDESGDLTQVSIDKVITSVKAIQGINKTKFRTNRLIISSRPFDGGLYSHLKSHHPHIIKNGFGRDVEYFISLYGFTKVQFNNWMIDSLVNYPDFQNLKASSLTKKIQDALIGMKFIDIYNELQANGTVSRSELRRPIFAYMILKLLVNNIDFFKVGKIGVYLSFINLLTKEAKYIDGESLVDLNKEFEFRNLLHSIAALSMHEWQVTKKFEVRKADICRVLEGAMTSESDDQILERYKNKGVLEIEFLSHSYFGENNNVLHIQHKSFLEILLAEYYLKVFIRYALDEDFDVEQARIKLQLGQPSAQTIQFLVEMLRLLRTSASDELNEKIIQKRKLLFPLMASLATNKNNNLFSHPIYYEWYKKSKIQPNHTDYPAESIENWFFTKDKIDRIIDLARAIVESSPEMLMIKGKSHTALFDNEIYELNNGSLQGTPVNIDKWLALLVGNILHNNEKNLDFFNSTIKKSECLFEMIRHWNFYSITDSSPFWAKSLFKGLDMSRFDEDYNFSFANLSGINFSHSYFKNINISSSKLIGCVFENVHFENVDLSFSDLTNSKFKSVVRIDGFLDLGFSLLSPEVFLPPQLAKKFYNSDFMGNQKSYIPESGFSTINQLFETLEGILEYGIKNGIISRDECATWFQFETMHLESLFERKISQLQTPAVQLS